MLKKPLLASTLFIASLLPAFAQDGQPASAAASPAPEGATAINTEAWDSFISFNGERILGDPAEHMYVPGVSYYTTFASVGKRIARSTVVPSFSTSGPLFGGDGYLTVSVVVPFETKYTVQTGFVGGWKYHLTEYIDLDVGGGMAFYDQNSFGAGQPNALGSKYRSAFYFGLIGRVLLQPAAYIVYDDQLEQVQAIISISENWELAENWNLFAEARAGNLTANSYLGDSRAPVGGKWQNGYAYWLTTAEISWTPIKNGKIALGVGYTGNNDGNIGFAGIDMGPEDTVYGKFSVSYSF